MNRGYCSFPVLGGDITVNYNINVPKPGVTICTAFCDIKTSAFRYSVFHLFHTFISILSDYLFQYVLTDSL